MLKVFKLFLLFAVTFNASSQRMTAKYLFPDSIINLKKGIYLTFDEFLNNNPGIQFEFEIIHKKHDYYTTPEETDKYHITYFDIIGNKKELELNEIWGFYDGLGVFVSFDKKPYELISLGSISLLRYAQYYNKNIISQTASLLTIGVTSTGKQEINEAYLDLRTGSVIAKKRKEFEKLIKHDIDFYLTYKKDTQTKTNLKPVKYLPLYNDKYPVVLLNEGLQLSHTY